MAMGKQLIDRFQYMSECFLANFALITQAHEDFEAFVSCYVRTDIGKPFFVMVHDWIVPA